MTDMDMLYAKMGLYASGGDPKTFIRLSATLSGNSVLLSFAELPQVISQNDRVIVELRSEQVASYSLQMKREADPIWLGEFHLVPSLREGGRWTLDFSKALRKNNHGVPMEIGDSDLFALRVVARDLSGMDYFSATFPLRLARTNIDEIGEDDMDRAFRLLGGLYEDYEV